MTALEHAGMSPVRNPDDGSVSLQHSQHHVTLCVLNTFQCSERNPGSRGGHISRYIQRRFDDSVLLTDHEWYQRQDACLNMLSAKLGISERGLGARSLDIQEVFQAESNKFLDAHHVMGAVNAPCRIALVGGNQIWGLGMFQTRGQYLECVRLCFHGHVPGGMSRIMASARRLHPGMPVSTFIDSRYATGAGHEVIGFKHVGWTPETYIWVFPDRTQHQRYLSNDNKCSRNLLYFNPEWTLTENIRANGIYRMWLPRKRKMLLA